MAKQAPRPKPRKSPPRSANLLTSLVLVLPLLIFYEIGVLFAQTMNGADLVTVWLLQLVGPARFLWIQLALMVAVLGMALYLKRKQQFELRQVLPVLLESAIYALSMGTLIGFMMVEVLGIDPRLATKDVLANAGLLDRLVMAVGAGFHEELLFRLLLMSGLIYLGDRVIGFRPWLSVGGAILISSLLFAGAHHIGEMGDPLRLGTFVYRSLAGVFFAVLYRYRSFAIAVYTHTLYDIYVMVIIA